MTERFSRGTDVAEVAGAGLGLHIVRKVAEAYGGQLALTNRPGGGLAAILSFRKLALVALLAALSGMAPERPAQAQSSELRLLAGIDRGLLDPLLAAFQAARPDIKVTIDRLDPQLALTRLQSQAAAGSSPDLVIGHAADVLVEMVNDGYASTGLKPLVPLVPRWSSWRDELFSFAFDEGVFVYRTAAFPETELPRSRTELVRFLDRQGEQLRNRVGTLDVGNNGTAYLLASQEARLSTSYWRLIRAFGFVETRIYWSTGEMVSALLKDEIDIAYNAISSELGALRSDDRFVILQAEDVRLVYPHAAFMPRQARAVDAALAFMRFVLSETGQALIERSGGTRLDRERYRNTKGGRGPPIQPVALGPGLLALRDLATRSALMETWLQIILTR